MKKGLKTGLIILSLISVAGIAASIMCLWGNNTAVSIIGGADGPTSVFIAGKIGNSTVIYIITGLCIIATFFGYGRTTAGFHKSRICGQSFY